jgi:hypothetical protein
MGTEITVRNALGDEIAQAVSNLQPGLYRSQMTVCRIRRGPDGFETTAEVVLTHCVDFHVTPPALEPVKGGAT